MKLHLERSGRKTIGLLGGNGIMTMTPIDHAIIGWHHCDYRFISLTLWWWTIWIRWGHKWTDHTHPRGTL